ncbi:MAG: hypothetical protein RLZZ277_908 [Actinomycetota bacterium]
MKTTYTLKRALVAASAVAALAVTVITPIAQAVTYSAPSAPTKVVANEGTNGITVSWTHLLQQLQRSLPTSSLPDLDHVQ